MTINRKFLAEAFEINIARHAHGRESISCSPEIYGDALFVVKRHGYEAGLTPAHAMDTDVFELHWRFLFGEKKRGSREKIKRSIYLIVNAMYGELVSRGMSGDAFDPQLAVCFMWAIADMGQSSSMGRQNLTVVYEESLRLASELQMKQTLEDNLEEKAKLPSLKV